MKIRNLDLTENTINEEHQQLGLPPVEDTVSHLDAHPFLKGAVWFAVITLVLLIAFLISRFFLAQSLGDSWGLLLLRLRAKFSGAR